MLYANQCFTRTQFGSNLVISNALQRLVSQDLKPILYNADQQLHLSVHLLIEPALAQVNTALFAEEQRLQSLGVAAWVFRGFAHAAALSKIRHGS